MSVFRISRGWYPFSLSWGKLNDVHSQNDTDTFHTSWITRIVDVQPLFNIASTIEPDQSSDCQFALNVSVNNISSAPVRLTQVSTVSPSWRSSLVFDNPLYVNVST